MPFRLYTVAETKKPIRTSGGMQIVPDYTIQNAPPPKVIVIPAQSQPSPAVLEWIRKSSKTTDVTMSVCTGAFVSGENRTAEREIRDHLSRRIRTFRHAISGHSAQARRALRREWKPRNRRRSFFRNRSGAPRGRTLLRSRGCPKDSLQHGISGRRLDESRFKSDLRHFTYVSPLSIRFALCAEWMLIQRSPRNLSLRARLIISVQKTTRKLSMRRRINLSPPPRLRRQYPARLIERETRIQKQHTVIRVRHAADRVRAGPNVEILDLVGPLQVFARASEMPRRENSGSPPIYSVEVVSISSSRSLIANCGVRITADRTFREVRGKIDTLLVAGGDAIEQNEINPEAVRWLKRISPRIRRVGSVCTGAMLLARAGLLDGRRATTHWNWCQTLIKRAPRARVERDPIFVRDENVYTSAGVTAGMDLALALVEEDHGSRLALQVARNLVLYLRRPGGQSQFSAALSLQLTDRKPLLELEAWVLDNLQKPLTVPLLAQRVAMSPRNFARVFTKEMKTTPAKFVERLRVEAARRRLEESHNSMEMIADECGFGNVNSMRNVFQRTLKIAPGQYRRHFRHVKHPPKAKIKR